MLISENSAPKAQSAISLKAAMMTAIIIFFGVLHIIGAVMMRDATTPRPSNTSEMVTSGD